MKAAICIIVKNENKYIQEWINYHKALGFDNIILYDNNDESGETPLDIINDEITNGFIIYNDKRGESCCQVLCYNECLNKYAQEFDWILFIDCDEFLYFNEKYSNVKQYINDFPDDAEQILIKWKYYTDNNIIYNNSTNILDTFTESLENDKNVESYVNVKSFIKTSINNIHELPIQHNFKDAHFIPTLYNTTYTADFNRLLPTRYLIYDTKLCVVNHYICKTITEYLERHSDDVLFNNNIALLNSKIRKFLSISSITKEKLEIIKTKYNWFTYQTSNDDKIDIVMIGGYNENNTLNSIIKNMTWVNNIFIIDSIYKKYELDNIFYINSVDLKTMSKNPYLTDIGLYLHYIQNLSNKFIYIYDNSIINYTCLKNEFFRQNKICMKPENIKNIPKYYRAQVTQNICALLNNNICDVWQIRQAQNNFGYMFSYTCCPMFKDDNTACFNYLLENNILDKSINHLIFPTWSKIMGHTVDYMHSNINIYELETPELELSNPIYKIMNTKCHKTVK